jgi:hypothetical protein
MTLSPSCTARIWLVLFRRGYWFRVNRCQCQTAHRLFSQFATALAKCVPMNTLIRKLTFRSSTLLLGHRLGLTAELSTDPTRFAKLVLLKLERAPRSTPDFKTDQIILKLGTLVLASPLPSHFLRQVGLAHVGQTGCSYENLYRRWRRLSARTFPGGSASRPSPSVAWSPSITARFTRRLVLETRCFVVEV